MDTINANIELLPTEEQYPVHGGTHVRGEGEFCSKLNLQRNVAVTLTVAVTYNCLIQLKKVNSVCMPVIL